MNLKMGMSNWARRYIKTIISVTIILTINSNFSNLSINFNNNIAKPFNPNVSEIAKHRLYSGLLQKLESNIKTLKDWMARLDSSIYNRIEIRTYQEFPVATYAFIDRETMDGFVQVEVCLYGIQVFDMPSYIVTKRNGGNFYDIHYKSFEKLWTNAKDIMKYDI